MDRADLYRWCSIPADKLAGHPGRRTPFRMVETREEMGELMAGELAAEIESSNKAKRDFRVIVHDHRGTGVFNP